MNSVTEIIDAILVCPVCHHSLPLADIRQLGKGECSHCHHSYTCTEGIFNLIPDPLPDNDMAEKWTLWSELQEHGELSYQLRPEQNLSVGPREDAKAFGRFCQLSGTVLDIGCGPQNLPSYIEGFSGRFVGIDPLYGELPKHFTFVQGIGEYLPFLDKTFDQVLFATSLDHTLNPARALREAQRVLKPDGKISIWTSEGLSFSQRLVTVLRDRDIKRVFRVIAKRLGLQQIHPDDAYLASLNTPEGAVDPYHFTDIDHNILKKWLGQTNLVIERATHLKGTNHFFVQASFS